jgi:hypothetical protein
MSKIYIKNTYFNNNTISIHLAETNNHYIIEKDICGLKSRTKVSKKRSNSLHYSIKQYSDSIESVRKIIESTNFYTTSKQIKPSAAKVA